MEDKTLFKTVTSSRNRSVGETGGSRHPQDKEEGKSPDKSGRQDFVGETGGKSTPTRRGGKQESR